MDTIEKHIIEIAKAFAAEKGWSWLEPIEVRLTSTPSGDKAWSVLTNVYARGRNIRLLILDSDLAVIEFAYLPR